MKRYALYIAFLFLTFAFSTAAAFVWNDQYWAFAVGSSGVCVDAGEGINSGTGGFSSYVFYDGTKLASNHARFDSDKDAERCFQFELQQANRIIERETLFDEAHEKVVGQRVVAIFLYANTEWTSIMNLEGDRIFEIISPSLRHALNFEKSNRKY